MYLEAADTTFPWKHEVDGGESSLHSFREFFSGISQHSGIVKGDRASGTQTHDLTFIIKKRNMNEVQRILHDVSDPYSTNYGQHLSKDEITDLTSNPESYRDVVDYLLAAGAILIPSETFGECITVRASVGLWERMLNTEFHSYTMRPLSVGDGMEDNTKLKSITVSRAVRYSVPLDLDPHVSSIINVVDIPLKISRLPQPARTPMGSKASFGSNHFAGSSATLYPYITPQSLNNAYSIDDNSGHPRATQAAYEGFGQFFCPEDLTAFQKLFKVPVVAANRTSSSHIASSIECKKWDYDICAESNLDMMYMLAMAITPTIHYYSTLWTFGLWLQFLVNGKSLPPRVISISYATLEKYASNGDGQLFNDNAIILGAMGVTIVCAAGDDGVGSSVVRSDSSQCSYSPSFPSTSPYVISVGATQVRMLACNTHICTLTTTLYFLIINCSHKLLHENLNLGFREVFA